MKKNNKTQIFIIDDDRSFCKSLKRLMAASGYPAYCFESAQSFIDAVPSGQKGVAVVDMHMPGQDGFSLLSTMQQLHYTMPVILMTGQTQNDTRDIALKRGAIGFLQKPFNERSIVELIEAQGQAEEGE